MNMMQQKKSKKGIDNVSAAYQKNDMSKDQFRGCGDSPTAC